MQSTKFAELAVNGMIKGITRVICRVDDSQWSKVPLRGPLILATNHVNFLEVPIVYTHLQPRPITGFAKAETWDNRLMGMLFNLWNAIPIQRGEADLNALRQGLLALESGKMLAVAPEGTRSGDGKLGQGHPGIVLMALKSGSPILPLVCYGGERFWDNFKLLKRTDFHLTVGRPFYLVPPGGPFTRDLRQMMVDEIMYQLAALLPTDYRGFYDNLALASERYLSFPKGSRSNLS